jgi:mannose-6-phosphate isomerase-like protein (cupin superfamily)
MSVFDLRDVYLWLNGKGGADKDKGGPEFWAAIGEKARPGATLVTMMEFAADWQSWERHPIGDEVLVALSGAMTILIETPNTVERHEMKAGNALVIPAGCWHTAEVQSPCRMLFLTYGDGTDHRPR